MPYDASRHDAMWLALWISIIFDLGTDSVDVRADVGSWFGWLIDAAQTAAPMIWLSLIGLGLLCNILCGRNHTQMIFTLKVVTPTEYQSYLENLKAATV